MSERISGRQFNKKADGFITNLESLWTYVQFLSYTKYFNIASNLLLFAKLI